jgi:hypothetical protein
MLPGFEGSKDRHPDDREVNGGVLGAWMMSASDVITSIRACSPVTRSQCMSIYAGKQTANTSIPAYCEILCSHFFTSVSAMAPILIPARSVMHDAGPD